jgi:hypothetical protein
MADAAMAQEQAESAFVKELGEFGATVSTRLLQVKVKAGRPLTEMETIEALVDDMPLALLREAAQWGVFLVTHPGDPRRAGA